MSEAIDTRVREGDVAPDFALPDDEGRMVRLSDFRGKTVVLYMYPKDNTPGCTAEACDFRDNMARVQSAGAVLLGLSPDSVASHRKFKEKYQLPFPLLADEGAKVADSYGAWVEKSMFGRKYMGIERSTFVIDGDGILRKVFSKVKIKGHVEQVLTAINSLPN